MDFLRYVPRGRAVADAYDEQFLQATQTSIDIFEALLENQPALRAFDEGERQHSTRERFRPFAAEGPALRALCRFLKRIDREERWGGLHRTTTHDGNILWLCEEHHRLYQDF
jgi:hypothetical protein